MTNEPPSMNCNCTPVYNTQYEVEHGSPVVAIAEAVATVKGVDPLELDPLYDVIDVDALDRLFAVRGETGTATTILRFTVDGWNVFIRDDGVIQICDPDTPAASAPVFERAAND